MYLMPLPFLAGTLGGLISIALLAGGIAIVWGWLTGTVTSMAWLASGIAMLAWSAIGRYVVLVFFPTGGDEPRTLRSTPGKRVQAPDGSILHVDFEGPADKPVLVLTHGWGLDSSAWYSVCRHLLPHYRLVLWDLPGLGRSSQPADGAYSIARLAEDLRRVTEEVGTQSVTLVGHSIGGMMILTLCRLHPDLLARRIAGIVFIDTMHTQPLHRSAGARMARWVLVEPLLLLTIALWPLVWLMNLQSYASGMTHIVNRITSFGPGVTRGQLDFSARLSSRFKPSVLAKGLRAILRWDESATPSRIAVPTRVVSGAKDRIAPPDTSEKMSAMIRGARFIEIVSAGHNGIIQESRQYAQAIGGLLEEMNRQAVTGTDASRMDIDRDGDAPSSDSRPPPMTN